MCRLDPTHAGSHGVTYRSGGGQNHGQPDRQADTAINPLKPAGSHKINPKNQ